MTPTELCPMCDRRYVPAARGPVLCPRCGIPPQLPGPPPSGGRRPAPAWQRSPHHPGLALGVLLAIACLILALWRC